VDRVQGKDFVGVADLGGSRLVSVLERAERLKHDRQIGRSHALLAGCVVALVFQKPSLRTRVSGRLQGVTAAYVGDGNNVAHSLMLAAPRVGLNLRVATPPEYRPAAEIASQAEALAEEASTELQIGDDPFSAVQGADFVYTDTWYSMGQEDEAAKRRPVFKPYQVNAELLRAAGPGVKVLHCLPAHRGDEITDEVLDGPASVVYDQAENRLHAQKALLVELLRRPCGAVGIQGRHGRMVGE
jgi:ornithine carbamoyltransferase